MSWTNKINQLAPLSSLAVETARFDTQKLQNPEISGVDYQQGTLFGYEVREYLLEKWQRVCSYCGGKDVPLEIDHIVPRSKGGSDRVSNLTLSCRKCNEKKSSQSLVDFLKDPTKRAKILAMSKAPLKDAAAINSIRFEIGNRLKSLGLPVEFATGGRTKYNRIQSGLPKDHWIDAACVGKEGENVGIHPNANILQIKATGRGSRQMCLPDKYGFPRTKAKAQKVVRGFKTGDFVKAIIPKGKYRGKHFGRIAIRSKGSFSINPGIRKPFDLNFKYCICVQKATGYHFAKTATNYALPPLPEGRGSRDVEV